MMAEARGSLKIFIGAVPGVGKTYRMLAEAHRRLERGQDIVVGFVEAHGRKATLELTEGLEQVPLEKIEYRGKTFTELDTAGVIARHPDWVLIDELAHTNIPGAKHEKRWQSINDVLDAGINVLSTVNIQHLESLNDVVFELTGVRVKETVPDVFLDQADDIELVDLPPDAILNRLKRGDIYGEEKISQALASFFTKANLIALRELVLRRTAEEVEDDLDEIMRRQQIFTGKVVNDFIVVCVSAQPRSGRLIRHGNNLAKRMKGKFVVLFVRIAGMALGKKAEQILTDLRRLTELLGGTFVELSGASIAKEIIDYVNNKHATMIVMGQTERGRVSDIMGRGIINNVMRETHNVDILLVANEETPSRRLAD